MTKPSWQNFGTHDESAYPELWDGVVGAWAPCLGPTGSRLHDHSRRSNWGTLTNMDNATDWVVDGGQYALDFDGVNDEITAAILPQLVNATQCTISFWFKRASISDFAGMVGFGVPSSESNRLVIQAWNDGRVYANTAPSTWGWFNSNDLFWHHIVCSYDGNQGSNSTRLRMWYDGKQQSLSYTGTIGATLGSPTGVRIGRTYTVQNHYGTGLIDDVIFLSRPSNDAEALQLYQLGRGGMYQRRRRPAIYLPQAGFQSAWALRRSQIIGGGLR